MLRLLETNANHPAPFADTIQAWINAATDDRVQTPGLIYTDQRFWPATTKHLLPKPEPCVDHPTYAAQNCSSCAGDVIAGDRPANMAGKHYEPPANAGGSPIQETQ